MGLIDILQHHTPPSLDIRIRVPSDIVLKTSVCQAYGLVLIDILQLLYTHVFIRLSSCLIGHRTQDVRGAQGTVTPDSTQQPPKPMG